MVKQKINNMKQEQDNYEAFEGLNLNDARSENESYVDYKKRLKQNRAILKMYKTTGRDNFKQMFPNGVQEALKTASITDEATDEKTVHNS
jgi:hypothetical protein